jgi:ferredoxin
VDVVKVHVDLDLCEGYGLCVKAAPEIFVIGDGDQVELRVEELPLAELANVREAVRRCPRGALALGKE